MNSEDLMFYINKHKKAYEERVKKEQQDSQNITSAEKSTVQANHLKPKEEITEIKNHQTVQSFPQNQNEGSNIKQKEDKIEEKKNVSNVEKRESQEDVKTISQEEADYLFALQLSEQLNGRLPDDVSIDQQTPIHNVYWNRPNIQQEENDKKPYQEDEVRKPDDIYTECLLGNVPSILDQTNFVEQPYAANNHLLNNLHLRNRRSFENNKYRYNDESNKEYKTKGMNKIDETIKQSRKGEVNTDKEKPTLPLKNNIIDGKEGRHTSLENKESRKKEISSSISSCNDYNRDPGTHTVITQKEKTKTETQNKGVDMYHKKPFNEPIYKERTYRERTLLNPIDLTQLSTGNNKYRENINTNDRTHNPTTSTDDKNLMKKTIGINVHTHMNPTTHSANMENQNKTNHNREAIYKHKYKNSHVHTGSNNKVNCETKHFHQEMDYKPLPIVKEPFSNFTEEYMNTMYMNRIQNRNSKNEIIDEEYYKKNKESLCKVNSRNATWRERNENSQGTNMYYTKTIRQQAPLQNRNNEKSIKTTKMENKSLSQRIKDIFYNTPYVHTSEPTNLSKENNIKEISKQNMCNSEERNTKSVVNNSLYSNEIDQKNKNSTKRKMLADTVQTQVQKEIIHNNVLKDKLIKKR